MNVVTNWKYYDLTITRRDKNKRCNSVTVQVKTHEKRAIQQSVTVHSTSTIHT